jgi:hypothetical protein
MLEDFLKRNLFEVATATLRWLWVTMGLGHWAFEEVMTLCRTARAGSLSESPPSLWAGWERQVQVMQVRRQGRWVSVGGAEVSTTKCAARGQLEMPEQT